MKTILKYYKLSKCFLLMGVLPLLISGCDKFDYSPYEVRLPEDMRDLNRKHIARIQAQNISDTETLRFVITSDTQGFYTHNDALVSHINQQPNVNFVLHNGDVTDFGILKEHELIHESFKKLKAPYVTVIGNHDALSNGKNLYKAMYGEFNFSFVVANRKFIFLNTNNWEFDGKAPDLGGLEKELQNTSQYQNTFVISHIPPNDAAFGLENIAPYKALLRKYNVSLSLHGHGHGFHYARDKEDDVYEMQVASTDKREYVLMSVSGSDIEFERVSF